MFSQLYMSLGVAMLYIYYFFAGREVTFVLIWTYKFLVIMLWVVLVCYTLDAVIYIVDEHMFCTLQAIKPTLKCKERNKHFLWQVTIFYFFWTPIWYACNLAVYRFARTANTKNRDRLFH